MALRRLSAFECLSKDNEQRVPDAEHMALRAVRYTRGAGAKWSTTCFFSMSLQTPKRKRPTNSDSALGRCSREIEDMDVKSKHPCPRRRFPRFRRGSLVSKTNVESPQAALAEEACQRPVRRFRSGTLVLRAAALAKNACQRPVRRFRSGSLVLRQAALADDACQQPVRRFRSGVLVSRPVALEDDVRQRSVRRFRRGSLASMTVLDHSPAGPARLLDFWRFVANALLGAQSEDILCRTFRLGGSIDNIGDVAFTRDEIIAHFLQRGDLQSAVWHCFLIIWLGAGGPQQQTYCWLRDMDLALPYVDTDAKVLHNLYVRVEQRVQQLGASAVFHGDSRAVRFRLDAQQQGERVLHDWHAAVPGIARVLEDGVHSPQEFDRMLQSVYFVGELTAKEAFVYLYYARPQVADTTRHVPVGDGARLGARLVMSGEHNRLHRASAVSGTDCPVAAVARTRDWALRSLTLLREACWDYQRAAPHRCDPVRNARVARQELLDLADVEVMLCYYGNYSKMRARFGGAAPPLSICPRGWTRR